MDFSTKKCKPCEGGSSPMTDSEIQNALKQLSGWKYEKGAITKTFSFKNYYETVAFINATAWISHREDHHPDIEFGYKKCTMRYSTHAIGGISENDFICAAKVDKLKGEAIL